jgi:hypothetical protein
MICDRDVWAAALLMADVDHDDHPSSRTAVAMPAISKSGTKPNSAFRQ